MEKGGGKKWNDMSLVYWYLYFYYDVLFFLLSICFYFVYIVYYNWNYIKENLINYIIFRKYEFLYINWFIVRCLLFYVDICRLCF